MLKTTIKPSSIQDKIDWIRLSRSHNIGRTSFFRLLDIFGSAKNALENISEFANKGGFRQSIRIYPEAQAILELENSNKFGAEIILFSDPQYPELLREIPDQPPIITALGNISLLQKKTLAIVGPRNCSFNGSKFAKKVAYDLGQEGFVIASGMARGIDSAAHYGSIETGTIAVIAGGIDNIYPPENEKLYHEIAKKGLIISETPFGILPKGGNFPQRNRIISGISLGTIVVEATLKSGTLITARCALEQNREIFAVPGSPFDHRCHGTNRLIKEGAKLIESAFDVTEDLFIDESKYKMKFAEPKGEDFKGFTFAPKDVDIESARTLLLSAIGYDPIVIDEVIDDLQIPVKVANIVLMQLELADKIEYKNGKISLKYQAQ